MVQMDQRKNELLLNKGMRSMNERREEVRLRREEEMDEGRG